MTNSIDKVIRHEKSQVQVLVGTKCLLINKKLFKNKQMSNPLVYTSNILGFLTYPSSKIIVFSSLSQDRNLHVKI